MARKFKQEIIETFKEEHNELNSLYKSIMFFNRQIINGSFYDPGIVYTLDNNFIVKYLSKKDYKEV